MGYTQWLYVGFPFSNLWLIFALSAQKGHVTESFEGIWIEFIPSNSVYILFVFSFCKMAFLFCDDGSEGFLSVAHLFGWSYQQGYHFCAAPD